MTNRPSFDELTKLANQSYEKTQDIRKTMKETGLPFWFVWEILGFKDYFDFVETGKD